MSSFVEPSRSRAVSRLAILAALAAGLAGCSSDFSRMGEVKRQSADLRELVQGVMEMVRYYLLKKQQGIILRRFLWISHWAN